MKRVIPLALLVAFVLPGCYAMDIDARALEPHLYVNREGAPGATPQSVGEFEVQTKASWALWGLVDLSEPEVAAVVERAISQANGTAAMDVVVVTQQTFLDGFLSAITLGLYGQRSTFVTGTVVR